MKTKKIFLILSLFLFCLSCYQKPAAYTGSKSDAIIRVSYTQPPETLSASDWKKADNDASEKCRNWGFTDAEKFDRGERRCLAYNAWGCIAWEYYLSYQCVDYMKN
tara:strand:- start:314 stop:631 length:318 start_codon:yes stop_codon:yes gene_type:complete